MLQYSTIEQQLEREGQILTVLHGTSMWPMIRMRRDPVLIRPLTAVRPDGQARRGDVVAYRLADRYVVHRVLRVCSDHYILRGDNCLGCERVPHDAVIGILTHWWRNGREHTTTDLSYRLYLALWLTFHPLYRLCRFLTSRR